MTSKLLYRAVLIELHKENAPNILLEDFNYFANKAINNYVNKRYNIYDVNQQTTDDLRVLKATAILTPVLVSDERLIGMTMAGHNKMATYEVNMPSDYLHLLNCICIYKVHKTYDCYNAGAYWRCAAKRLTADMYSLVIDNFWTKPDYKNPYYYIHNVNTLDVVPTYPYNTIDYNVDETNLIKKPNGDIIGGYKISYEDYNDESLASFKKKIITYYDKEGNIDRTESEAIRVIPNSIGGGTDVNNVVSEGSYHNNPNGTENSSSYLYGKDGKGINIYQGSGLPDGIELNGGKRGSLRERGQGIRYGNVSNVRLEIRYGTDNSVFELVRVLVDYIKAPQFIRLTQEELDLTEDTSQMLEYPDYVCQEIINELVHLIMENISDQRLQTHPVVSQSIANPAQALAPAQGLSAQL